MPASCKAPGVLVVAVLAACGPPMDSVTSAPHFVTDETLQQPASIFEPELGKGVNAAETQTYARCVVFPPVDVQPTGFQNRLYNEYSISSRQEMDSKLDVSASVSARGMWGAAGASGAYFKDVDVTEEAFYWLVDARYVLQHESIDSSSPAFQLSGLAQQVLSQRGIAGFTKACGTHFYSGRTLGARYNLLYEFKSHEDKFVERIKAAASYSGFGVEAEAEMNKYVAIAKKSAYVRVHSGIEGGGYSIADYATDAASLKAELARLREDLMVRRQGEVLTWEMSSYDMFPEVQAAKDDATNHLPTADDYKRDALGYYYTQYTSNRAQVARYATLLERSSGQEPWLVYSAEGHTALRNAMASLRQRNDDIARRAVDCLQSADALCSTTGLEPLDVSEPTPVRDLSALGGWSVYPILRHDSKAMVDFYGSPGGDYSGRIFETHQTVFTSPAGAYVMAGADPSHRVPLLIGTFDMYATPQGTSRPRLCIDEFADVCNFRAIESPSAVMDDGYPFTRLQLTVFDANGLQTNKYVFRAVQ